MGEEGEGLGSRYHLSNLCKYLYLWVGIGERPVDNERGVPPSE